MVHAHNNMNKFYAAFIAAAMLLTAGFGYLVFQTLEDLTAPTTDVMELMK